MAVLSVNLVPYSIQEARNTTRHQTTTVGPTQNAKPDVTISRTVITTKVPHFHTNTTVANDRSTHTPDSRRRKVVKRKRIPKHRDNVPAQSTSHTMTSQNLVPESDMQVLQFYAQPLNSFDLNVQPMNTFDYEPITGSNAFSTMNQQSLFVSNPNSYLGPVSTLPSVSPLPYKTLPQEDYLLSSDFLPKPITYKPTTYNWNLPSEQALKPIPVYDPFNVYKTHARKPKYHTLPVQEQKFLTTVRPVTPSVSMLPPVTVTHVYKYTNEPELKLPFLHQEDSIDDSLPILSAALEDHFNDRIANVGVKKYLAPPAFTQPVIYNIPTVTIPTGTGNPDFQHEFQLINKFNEDLRSHQHETADPEDATDDKDETQEEKNYTDEDVKKALLYIQSLKRNKSNRGPKKYNGEDENGLGGKKGKKLPPADEEDEEVESNTRIKKRRRKKPREEFVFEEEEEEYQKGFSGEDRSPEEGQKNYIQAERKDSNLRSQETQIVPNTNEEEEVNLKKFNFEGCGDLNF